MRAHRHTQAMFVGNLFEDLARQPTAFRAEQQQVASLVSHLRVVVACLGGEREDACG